MKHSAFYNTEKKKIGVRQPSQSQDGFSSLSSSALILVTTAHLFCVKACSLNINTQLI